MLKLPIIALLLRTIPEGLVIILACYFLGNKFLDYRKILTSAGIMGVAIYLVRLLPIHFGVHTIITLIIFVFILHTINEFDTVNAVKVSVISILFLFMSEWISIIFYMKLLKLTPDILFDYGIYTYLLGLPSLLLVAVLAYGVKTVQQRMVTRSQ